jgi:hypothetical protein
MNRELKEQVREVAFRHGADLVGFAPVDRFHSAPKMLHPLDHMPTARTVVVVAIKFPYTIFETAAVTPADTLTSYVTYIKTMNSIKLPNLSYEISRYLEDQGHRAIAFMPTGYWRVFPYKEVKTAHTADFSHRHAAVAAGLGGFGLHGLAMTPEFGVRQRFVSVITEAEIEPTPMCDVEDICDECGHCAGACRLKCFDTDTMDELSIGDKTYRYWKHDHWRCAWSEHYRLYAADGQWCYGFEDNQEPPEVIDRETLRKAFSKRDPIDYTSSGIMGWCLRECARHIGPDKRVDREANRLGKVGA